MNLNIKDRVKGKKTKGSFQCEGTVVAIYEPEYFHDICKFNYDWDKDQLVALVKFDEYKKSATLEEWVASAIKQGLSKEEALLDYDQCPVTNVVAIPFDGLMKI